MIDIFKNSEHDDFRIFAPRIFTEFVEHFPTIHFRHKSIE